MPKTEKKYTLTIGQSLENGKSGSLTNSQSAENGKKVTID